MSANKQIQNEAIKLCRRWDRECDLSAYEIAKAIMHGLNEWLDEDIFIFESEEDEEQEEKS